MLGQIVGALWGTAVGCVTALLPGTSAMQATWGAAAISIVAPLATPVSVLCANVTHVVVGSIKEAVAPLLSGSPSVLAAVTPQSAAELAESIEPRHFALSLIMGKVLAATLGAIVGLVFGGIIAAINVPGAVLSLLIGCGLIAAAKSRNDISLEKAIMWLAGMQAWFLLAQILGVTNPVYVLSICMFLIPAAARGWKVSNRCGALKPPLTINPMATAGGSAVALFTPGVSAAAITTGVSKPGLSNLVTAACTDAALEAMAITMMAFYGFTTGKTAMGTELGMIAPGHVFLAVGILMLATFIALALVPLVLGLYQNQAILSGFRLIYIAMLPIYAIVTCGAAAFILIPGGLALYWAQTKYLRGELRSLTFLGLVL